jgi:hypothetical protein
MVCDEIELPRKQVATEIILEQTNYVSKDFSEHCGQSFPGSSCSGLQAPGAPVDVQKGLHNFPASFNQFSSLMEARPHA